MNNIKTVVSALSCSLFIFACSLSCKVSSKSNNQELIERLADDVNVTTITTTTSAQVTPSARLNMREIEGEYCPEVEQKCLQWVDALGNPTDAPKPGLTGRCGEFKNPSVCLTPEGTRPRKHFYIDTYEYPNVAGQVPQSWMTWHDVKRACESQGKRLCTRSEWTMACEGPGMHPYPYGDGYHRDRTSCNTDNPVGKLDVFKSKAPHDEMSTKLDSLLVPSGSKPQCVSVWGVYDQVGNIDEQIVNETGRPYKSGLVGGHVFGVRNACRPMTEAHNEEFGWYETGGRCCISNDYQ